MFLFMIVYLLLVLIRPQDYPDLVDSITLPLQPIALLLAAGFWLLSPRKNFDAPHYVILLAFLVALMLSKVFNGWSGGAIVQFTKFAPVILAFTVLAHCVTERSRLLWVMAVFAACAGVLALHGIDQVEHGIGWTGVGLSQETRIQYVGIFNDPNDLGLLFVMCLPMAVYLGSRGGLMGLRKLFWLAVTGVLVYGIYLTNSRGTLLAFVLILGIYVWKTRGIFLAGILGVGALSVMMMLPSRLQEMDVSEASAAGRVESWYEGLQMFISSPVFGIGADGYSDLHNLTAHNSFVLVLAETGIVGFTLWLAFVGYCFRMMMAVLRQREGVPDAAHDPVAARSWREDRAIAMTLLLALYGFFASAFFLSRSYVVILYLLAALVVGHYAGMRQRFPQLPQFLLSRDALNWPLWSVGGVIGLYLTVKVLLAML
jgi:putative inorganic carbon (hco3(-)) transporter